MVCKTRDRRNGEIELEMTLVVPGERADRSPGRILKRFNTFINR